MAVFSSRGDEGRARSADSRKSRQGRLFWVGSWGASRLEKRVLPTLTFTSFPIPLVALVQPAGITTGPDGNLWFTESGSGEIGRMTPSGALTEFPLPTVPPPAGAAPGTPAEPPQPQGIVSGPDGALWFTTSDSLIGRISTSGTITEFKVDGLTLPNSTITLGPDGNLWFTGVPGAVGRITPSGTVTEFPVPETPPPPGAPSGTAPSPTTVNAITVGPDGALWFTGLEDEIGRITTSGKISEFALPLPTSVWAGPVPSQVTATGITTGPDGALWFTVSFSENAGEVGRMTTSGTVTTFPTPANTTPGALICTGPDGNLWFTTSSPNLGNPAIISVACITPSGTVSSFQVPGTFQTIAGITAGPDGNLWFTEQEVGTAPVEQPAVGKITPSGVATLYTLPQGTTLDPSRGVPADPTAITAGPDGDLWFTESSGLGRISTSGSIQVFAVPAPGETPDQITAGPGGVVWFTLTGTAADGSQEAGIGTITRAGAISIYPSPDGTAFGGIAAGPDGNLWFTDNFNFNNTAGSSVEYIGRINPHGQVKLFNLHAKAVTLTGITSGPDGNLWFTGEKNPGGQSAVPFVGRISTRGQVRIFDFPGGRNPYFSYGPPAPSNPVSGPDGQIWFEAMIKNVPSLARISTKGKFETIGPLDFTPYGDLVPLPDGRVFFGTGSAVGIATRSGILTTQDAAGTPLTGPGASYGLTQLAAGPDGNLWFADSSSVYRITGLDTVNGGLDDAHRPRKEPDRDDGSWTNATGTARPTFAGIASPGAEVTLFARLQGDTQSVQIGRVWADRGDGSWKLTSHVALSNGNYEVTAIQQGDSQSPSVLYSLEPDSSGNLSNALVIAVPHRSKATATPDESSPVHHASSSRRSSG